VIDCKFDMDPAEPLSRFGSSFKPYVLSLSRQEGMNVRTSTLDRLLAALHPACLASLDVREPDHPGELRQLVRGGNDVGDGSVGPVTVTSATALSLNTAYADSTTGRPARTARPSSTWPGLRRGHQGLWAEHNEARGRHPAARPGVTDR